MAKTSMVVKNQRPAKFSTQAYTRCERCGRPHSVYRKFKLCRICLRDLAYKGQLPGVKKKLLGKKHLLIRYRNYLTEMVFFVFSSAVK